MIYCGYQGSGKSTYCRNNPTTTVDLDSSGFTKELGWEKGYIEKAKEYSDGGKNVFISAHKIVLEYLLENGINFELIIPGENRLAWKSRLEFRHNKNPILPNLKAIYDFEQNYDKDMAFYKELESKGVKVHKVNAKIVTTIDEFISQ